MGDGDFSPSPATLSLPALNEVPDARRAFFKALFRDLSGYLCLASKGPGGPKDWSERFFRYPAELDDALRFIERASGGRDCYFAPNLFTTNKKSKGSVKDSNVVWADLDQCNPDQLWLEPSVTLQSSPDRWQAFWFLSTAIPAVDAELKSKRVAYQYKDKGADKSGWDITQVLRVPYTRNFKHNPPFSIETKITGALYAPSEFETLAPIEAEDRPLPKVLPKQDPLTLLSSHETGVPGDILSLFHEPPPDGKWSDCLWKLERLLAEARFPAEEIFVIAKAAACNKYARDNRPDEDLWKEVCKAVAQRPELEIMAPDQPIRVDLMSVMERNWASSVYNGVVSDYVRWGSDAIDAPPEYHEAGILMVLSCLLADRIRLDASFGAIKPNLWFMLLADTTLTRKSTSMDMAVETLHEVDPDAVLATDGSIEGILSGLAARPSRASLFLRDEFSGFMDQMSKRDYMAGMIEVLTKLYDGRHQRRMLRKEIIEVRHPVFIMFTAGIRRKILSQITEEHIFSGFIPRFIFVTAFADPTKVKPLGPPVEASLTGHYALIAKLRKIYEHYHVEQIVRVGGKEISSPKEWHIKMTPQAWKRYNKAEAELGILAAESPQADLVTPVLSRLAISGLKVAMLLAAIDRLEDEIVITDKDIIRALWFVERWADHALDIIRNSGKTDIEKLITEIYDEILRKPGIPRSHLMNRFRLTAKAATEIFETLTQRGLVKGKGTNGFFPNE